jgi:hypothetical protein
MTDPMTDVNSPDPHEGESEFTIESLDGRAQRPARTWLLDCTTGNIRSTRHG